MNNLQYQKFARLFSQIKLINYDIHDNNVSVNDAIKRCIKRHGDASEKKQLVNYFCLNKSPRATYTVSVSDGVNTLWVKTIENNRAFAKWLGENAVSHISRGLPEIEYSYKIIKSR